MLGILVVARRPTPGSRTIAALMVAMTIWSIAHGIELLQPPLEGNFSERASTSTPLGSMAYEALPGGRVATGEKRGELIVSVLNEKPAPASSLFARFPPAIDEIFDAALAKNPLARTTDLEQ